MELYFGTPYWLALNRLNNYCNLLRADRRCDVTVIGSGITGALVAYELGRAGMRCVMIDRGGAAAGSSTASTALLQYEIDVPLHRMERMIPRNDAVVAYRSCLRSIDDLVSVFRAIGYDPAFERRSSVWYASDRSGRRMVEREFTARKRHGLPCEYLGRRELKRVFGIDAPCALVNDVSAQMDPYAAATALIGYGMQAQGLELFTHTEAVRIDEEPGCCRTHTPGGVITSRYVVVAAGFDAGRFLPERVMKLTSTYALASEPVDSSLIWPRRALLWETRSPYLYVRTSGDRIIAGGEDDAFSDPARRDRCVEARTAAIERKLRELLPGTPFRVAMKWCGTFSTTEDGLPYIGPWKPGSRVFFDLGYGGNGITFSMIGAQIIAGAMSGRPDPRAETFGFSRISRRK